MLGFSDSKLVNEFLRHLVADVRSPPAQAKSHWTIGYRLGRRSTGRNGEGQDGRWQLRFWRNFCGWKGASVVPCVGIGKTMRKRLLRVGASWLTRQGIYCIVSVSRESNGSPVAEERADASSAADSLWPPSAVYPQQGTNHHSGQNTQCPGHHQSRSDSELLSQPTGQQTPQSMPTHQQRQVKRHDTAADVRPRLAAALPWLHLSETAASSGPPPGASPRRTPRVGISAATAWATPKAAAAATIPFRPILRSRDASNAPTSAPHALRC